MGAKFHWEIKGSIPLGGELVLPMSTGTIAVGGQPRAALPLLPLWSGLAIDSGFYAVVLTALVGLGRQVARAPRGLRAWRRRRAGQCVRCAYDRCGLAPDAKCPECGTPTAPAPK